MLDKAFVCRFIGKKRSAQICADLKYWQKCQQDIKR